MSLKINKPLDILHEGFYYMVIYLIQIDYNLKLAGHSFAFTLSNGHSRQI
jgi:hypothetical protein